MTCSHTKLTRQIHTGQDDEDVTRIYQCDGCLADVYIERWHVIPLPGPDLEDHSEHW